VSRLLLLNDGASSIRVLVRLAGAASATVQRLLASSVLARSGATLNGQWLGGDARWRGRPTNQALALTNRPAVSVAPHSAALVIFRAGR
jgi:hypothetical protein